MKKLLIKLWQWFAIKYVFEDPKTCAHEWEVYSTALADVCLELHCSKCAIVGAVNKPTKEEWAKAFDAPSNPYSWTENDRVAVGSRQLI